jgi:SAM-dependent methyltransferase
VLRNWFDDDVAANYDADEASMFEPATLDATVDFLAEQAAGGSAVEFAIGTGRVALPLAARGVPVAGIDLSPQMVERLRAKPGGDEARVPVVIGDMTTETAGEPGTRNLVYTVFNSINNLTTQDAQVACFANAARHLRPGGVFVVEVAVPALRLLPPGQRFVLFDVSPQHIGIDEYEPVEQGLISHHTTLRDDGLARVSVPFRYVWPAELDLMARLAGMRRRERWADWNRSAFTGDSEAHVSVWEKPVAP